MAADEGLLQTAGTGNTTTIKTIKTINDKQQYNKQLQKLRMGVKNGNRND
jgi:hypothetical protein